MESIHQDYILAGAKLQFDSVCSADEFQQAATRWFGAGVQIVGGCRGIGAAHIEALRRNRVLAGF